ncbi:aminoglycoside phosphotransferase family protein [Paenibacillus qinlingensis]|uniref:CotS family spore coat protein n=1 Tax=Paenibacillus qinlingensis TaxID=1837343 RepID=A0ABU1NSV3_9BACL|nr:aminoglycoside phosphotransferase family protein [Paenibacillus qinlingensis]MDR6549952.1 CotS family spore coat protein [Paenibacillus qinlingensis]
MGKGLLKAVALTYSLTIERVELIRHTSRAFVVKITADEGLFILKRMRMDEYRLRHMLDVEDFLRSRGIHIPFVYPTDEAQNYMRYKGNLYVLQQWICGVAYPLTTVDKAVKLAALLGSIHMISKEYPASIGPIYHGSARWEREYEEALCYLERWKNESLQSDEPWRLAVLSYIDFSIATGKYVQEQISACSRAWKENQPQLVVSHNDFHLQNIVQAESQDIYILDWEFVRFDVPSRDLNRLLYAIVKKTSGWNPLVFKKVMRAYLAQNGLTSHEMKFMYLDLAFPHNVCRNLLWGKFSRMTGEQIKDLLQKEQDKAVYLLEAYRK